MSAAGIGYSVEGGEIINSDSIICRYNKVLRNSRACHET